MPIFSAKSYTCSLKLKKTKKTLQTHLCTWLNISELFGVISDLFLANFCSVFHIGLYQSSETTRLCEVKACPQLAECFS